MVRTDEELVKACLDGETSAFDILVGRWDRKIRGTIYRIVGSEDEARDVSQETFLRAYRALPGFKGEARFSSWLYRIAVNLSRDRLRRRRGKLLVSLDDVPPPSDATEPARLLEGLDLRRRVAAAVSRLPPEQREIVTLKEYEGLTFAEIAAVLGEPVSTVKTRLYRALTQLRGTLDPTPTRHLPDPSPITGDVS